MCGNLLCKRFRSSPRIWARLQTRTGKCKAFYYHFDQRPDHPADSPRAGYGSPHAAFSDANPLVMFFSQTVHTGLVPSAESLKVLDAYFAWRWTPEGEAWAK